MGSLESGESEGDVEGDAVDDHVAVGLQDDGIGYEIGLFARGLLEVSEALLLQHLWFVMILLDSCVGIYRYL